MPGAPGDQTLVVGQRADESPIDLARRVLRTVAGVSTFERTLQRAVVFIAPRLDDAAMTARHVMARALMQGVSSAGDLAELVLVVDGAAEPELRHTILSLVEVLVVAPGALPVPIRVRFEACDVPVAQASVRESGLRFRAVKVKHGDVDRSGKRESWAALRRKTS